MMINATSIRVEDQQMAVGSGSEATVGSRHVYIKTIEHGADAGSSGCGNVTESINENREIPHYLQETRKQTELCMTGHHQPGVGLEATA